MKVEEVYDMTSSLNGKTLKVTQAEYEGENCIIFESLEGDRFAVGV